MQLPMSTFAIPVLSVVLAVPAFAQAPTFVVDAANGPGTHYTNLQTAVSSVPDGSNLIVRSGNYGSLDVGQRGVALLGEPGATILLLSIHDTLSSQRVLITGMTVAGRIEVQNAAGPVVLDGNGQPLVGGPLYAVGILTASQVHLRRWTVSTSVGNWPLLINSSKVVVEQCTVTGRNFGGASVPNQPAISAFSSTVHVVDSDCRGGNGGTQYVPFALHTPGAAAIQLMQSTLHVAGSSTVAGGLNSPLVGGYGSALVGTSTEVAHVHASVASTTPLTTSVTVQASTAPVLRTVEGGIGGVCTATRTGAPNTVCGLFASLCVEPFVFPGIVEPIWLDPLTLVAVAVGISDASGAMSASLPVPNLQALLGFTFLWQAVDLDPSGQLQPSNPSASFVR